MAQATVQGVAAEYTFWEFVCVDCNSSLFLDADGLADLGVSIGEDGEPDFANVDEGEVVLCDRCQNYRAYLKRYDLPPSKRPEDKPLESFPWIVDMRVWETRRDVVILRGDWGAVGATEVFLPVPKDMIHNFTYGTRVQGELRVTINRKHEKSGEA